MDIEKKIEFLEVLVSIPMPPNPAPVPTAREGVVKVPEPIIDYLKKIDVEVEETEMSVIDYLTLLEDNNIPVHGISIVTMLDQNQKEND